MSEPIAEYVAALREALPVVEWDADHWNDWQGEEDNLRRQRAGRELADRIRALIDGSGDAT